MRPQHRGRACLLAALLVACAPSALAQAATLKQGFDAAWQRQPEQRAASLRRDAASASLSAAQRWTPEPPALEASAKSDRYTRNEGVREYDATLAVPIWLPGERPRAQAAASSEATAVDARQRAAQWRLAALVREAYWACQRAAIEQQLATRRLDHAQQLAQDVARRVRAGDLARADSHQAEGALAAAQAASMDAQAARVKAERAWTALTGLPEAPGADTAPEPRPLDAGAPAAHPAVGELDALSELARRQGDLAAVQVRANPELTFGAVRERDALGERFGQSLVVGVRIPLGRSSASEARIINAHADALEAQTRHALELQRVDLQVQADRATLQALDEVSRTAERRVSLARESRDFFDKSFRLGETDLPTRLRVELEAVEAERQAARSRLEVDAAVSSLRQAMGLLPQ